jgi:hypothetical protein
MLCPRVEVVPDEETCPLFLCRATDKVATRLFVNDFSSIRASFWSVYVS